METRQRSPPSPSAMRSVLCPTPPPPPSKRTFRPHQSACKVRLNDRHRRLLSQSFTKEGSDLPAVFTIIRPPYPGTVSIAFSLGGSADAGQDYESPPLEVSLPSDVSAADIYIWAKEDQQVEKEEIVELTLKAPAGYDILGNEKAQITIHDKVRGVWSGVWCFARPSSFGAHELPQNVCAPFL